MFNFFSNSLSPFDTTELENENMQTLINLLPHTISTFLDMSGKILLISTSSLLAFFIAKQLRPPLHMDSHKNVSNLIFMDLEWWIKFR